MAGNIQSDVIKDKFMKQEIISNLNFANTRVV